MQKKSLDISLIKDDEADLTFFNIDEEETNETLRALKQSYVTTNYKEETILNLQNSLNTKSKNTSKELKLESYKRYNNALDLANKNYITTALEIIEKALEINPKDVDILNLKGLLKLLKCDFSKAFESFYTGMCYGSHELSRKYVDMLSSEDFNVFLSRYNHSIRFINEELNQESIHILNNIIEENPELIEPYVILSLLYDKLNNVKKREAYLEYLKDIDKDNPLFETNNKLEEEREDKNKQVKNTKKLHILPYAVIGCLIFGMGAYYLNSKNKMENLNSELAQKSEELNKTGKKLTEKEDKLNEASGALDETSKELEKTNQELNQTSQKLDEAKTKEILSSDDGTIYQYAMKLKNSGNYESSIKYLKQIVKNGNTKQYISESIYQIALLSEKSNNKEQAKIYYKKYINTYTPEDKYYDDAFYQLGMLYYSNGELKSAKDTFYGLRSEVPNSMYNNSKVKEILNEK
ncbi:tetratricopeptide repeat protein [Romboutsia sp.]|uniref:tetratricopeptide repeat protein n=1 Tax=Romboutsia sp. TaxID=1965302 RepID=UPI003F331602